MIRPWSRDVTDRHGIHVEAGMIQGQTRTDTSTANILGQRRQRACWQSLA
jgi:hypothetical protein